MAVSDRGVTRDGAYRLALDPALSIDNVRAGLNRLRMQGEVLYASALDSVAAAGSGTRVIRDADQQPPIHRLIVKFKDPLTSAASARNETLAPQYLDRLSTIAGQPIATERAMSGGAFVVRLSQSLPVAQARALANDIEMDPTVEYAQPDERKFPTLTPNDPSYANQWHYMSPPAEMGGVNLPPAWNITTGSPSIKIAVIDTGILAHPDLAGRYVGGYDFILDSIVANDNSSTCATAPTTACFNSRDSDPSDPGDWVSPADIAPGNWLNGQGCSVRNSSWHGTHVTGTIAAATNNASGVAGINWVSQVVPLRVLGKCGGYDSDVIDAMSWGAGIAVPGVPANTNVARVESLSLGGSGPSCPAAYQTAINAILAAGTTIVIAAGNGNTDAMNSIPGNCNGIITVAAAGRAGQRAFYSNFGSLVEIAAPGGSSTDAPSTGVLSTLNSGAMTPVPNDPFYQYYQGTSMATPHVSGIASLMLSVNPSLTPAQVLAMIQTTARAFPTGTVRDCTTALCGAGIIDAGAAVAAAAPPPPGLVYTPVVPCRIMDTRNATAGSGVQGPIVGGALEQIPGFVTSGSNWTQYGQTGTPSDCGLTNPPGISIKAVAVVITILNPNFDAFLGVSDINSLTTTLATVALNYTHGQSLSTMYIVPQIASNNIYFAMPASLSAQLIFDVVGYFVLSDATALQCATVSSSPVTIGMGTSGSATSPACSAGYTLTSGSCDSTSSTMKLVSDKASGVNTTWSCTVNNPGTAGTLTARANCCRVPGK